MKPPQSLQFDDRLPVAFETETLRPRTRSAHHNRKQRTSRNDDSTHEHSYGAQNDRLAFVPAANGSCDCSHSRILTPSAGIPHPIAVVSSCTLERLSGTDP
jgi:hypothetical protein